MGIHKEIVVIGGGAIGLSVAYHLGRLGCPNVVLLERNELTSGTSWHAAGIVGPLRGSQNLTVLAKYALTLFADLEAETGQATGYKQTGGLWLAQHSQRMRELHRIAAMGMMNGLHTDILSPAEIKQKFDLLNTRDLAGGMWVEQDGQVNPVDLCMAYAKAARALGVEIREHTGVASMEMHNHNVTSVVLDNGERLPCNAVVNCAGLWAREIGNMVGVAVPLQAVEHIYVVTEPIPTLPRVTPILRDLDNGIYIKEDAGKLVLGAFEQNARLWDPASVNPKESFLAFGEDWDHVEPMLNAGLHRLPCLQETGITQFMNGPESFTPDTRQIMGRAPNVENFYVAAGFNSIGIMSSAGVGKVMADWVTMGRAPMDLWEVDIQRFEPADNDPVFLNARIPESVHNQFQMHWPYKQFVTGRNRKQSVWHDVMAKQGAVFAAMAGWERPLWFARGDEDKAIVDSHDTQNWWRMAQRESKTLQQYGGVFELSPFTKIVVSGNDALKLLQRLCCNDLDVPTGKIVYTLMLNQQGGIETECTVIRCAEDVFMVVSGAATRTRDRCWMASHVQEDEAVCINDRTDDYAVVGVMGPQSRALLSSISEQDFSQHEFGFAHSKMIAIGDAEVRACRLSYVGELGWELFIPVEAAVRVLETIVAEMHKHKMDMAGHFCLECCRLEKGYLHWGPDIGSEENPLEANLGFAVKLDKPGGFIGRDALMQHQRVGLEKHLVLFEVEAANPLLLHDEPIFCDGVWVGQTTSGGLGFRTASPEPNRLQTGRQGLANSDLTDHGKALCLGYISLHGASRATLLKQQFEIEVAGNRFALHPLRRCPYDPKGLKMRG